ncbi:MAG: ATP-binding protein [Chloroflexota bacterium]
MALRPLVDDLRRALAPQLAETGGSIELIGAPATPLGDPVLLGVALRHLVANAIEHRRPGTAPHVRVSARADEGVVRIAVADDGPGIPPEAIDRIFEVFVRMTPDQDLSHAGIGLATVRRAVRAMRGTVSVDSPPGAGATFTIELPAA